MTTKSAQENPKKQQQIIETAEVLFLRHGIKRVTVEEICQKAGVSKMTFYKYFTNKIDLVKHIWNSWMQEARAKLEELNEIDIPFAEKIEQMFAWKTELLTKMSTEFIEEFLPINMGVEETKQWFLEFISEAKRRGDIRAAIRPELLMAVLDKYYELAQDEDLIRKYPSIIEFNRELKDLLWYGLLTRPEVERKNERETTHLNRQNR
jgi:AcrR family transcriptional regulator